jgi:hypothetical protein
LTPFTIPPKQVLIVTSGRISLSVATSSPLLVAVAFTVGGQSFAQHTVLTDASGFADDVTFSMPNGLAVSSGNTICASVSAASTVTAELHGFLAPNK